MVAACRYLARLPGVVAIRKCAYCQAPIGWLSVRGRPRPVPFARDLMEREKDTLQAGFVLRGSRLTGAVWVPVREVSEFKLRDVKWVAMRHHCDAYEIAKMNVSGMDWADEWTRSMLMSLHAAEKRLRDRARKM